MNRSRQFCVGVLVCGFVMLSTVISAQGDDLKKPLGPQPSLRFTVGEGEGNQGIVVQLGGPSEYWIGVVVEPLDEEDRAEAKLPEGQGLEIERVIADSPAAKAGLREEDIVLGVDGKGSGSLAELQKLVGESDGKVMIFEVLRDGKKTKIEVTPAKRAEAQSIVVVEANEERADEDVENEGREQGEGQPMVIELHKLMERAQLEAEGQRSGQPGQWQVVPGGPAWRAQPAAIPEDLSVTIKKKGSKPARIKVSRGIQSWTVNENELSKLPDDIRGYVLRTMAGSSGAFVPLAVPVQPGMRMMNIRQSRSEMLPAQPMGAPNPNPARARSATDQVLQEMQALKHQLHLLQEQLKTLREKQ